MKYTANNLRKISAVVFIAFAAVDVISVVDAISKNYIYSLSNLYKFPLYLSTGELIVMWLKSLLPLFYHIFVVALSVILAVRLLKNKNETLLLRIFCLGNAAYFAYLAINGGLFNQITYFGEFFGNLNLMSVQILVTAALLIAIAVLYSNTCGKRQANALVILSAVIYTASTVVHLINVISSGIAVTPVYSTVISIIAAVLAYLPLLLICIQKRIDSHKEEL